MKRFLSLLAASALTVGTLTPTKASNNNLEDHRHLWQAIRQVGVSTLVNTPEYCDDSVASGMYISALQILVICQENAKSHYEVEWTTYDLDTLRHEAHHLVQDCALGRIGDDKMERMFNEPEQAKRFVTSILTPEQVNHIIKTYTKHGADQHTILMELEAFAVAEGIDAELITKKVLDWCGTN